MQQIKLYFTKKEQVNMFFNFLVYIIFLGYSIYLFSSNLKDPFNWFMLAIAFAFLTFSILKEFLNFHFKKAIYLLTIKCDPKAGLNQITKVERYDLFKSFDSACLIFRVLALLDQHDAENLSQLLDNIPTDQVKDLLLVKAYANFKITIFNKNKTQMKKAFASLITFKDIKHKGKAIFSPLFSWEDIEAEYEYRMNDFKKANSLLNKANMAAMNQRELAQHAFLQAEVFVHLDKLKEALGLYQEVVLMSSLNAYGEEAKIAITKLGEVHESPKISR